MLITSADCQESIPGLISSARNSPSSATENFSILDRDSPVGSVPNAMWRAPGRFALLIGFSMIYLLLGTPLHKLVPSNGPANPLFGILLFCIQLAHCMPPMEHRLPTIYK